SATLIWYFYSADRKKDSSRDLEADVVSPRVEEKSFLPGDMQLRIAGSQTVSRPEFRELAEFEYTDVQGGYNARGNPDLQRATLSNLDISLEWFLSGADRFSVGAFYKIFEDPIEVVNLPTGGNLLTTWENADKADLLGIEVEGRKSLGFLSDHLKDQLDNLSLIANFTWMDSEVETKTDASNLQTNKKRTLQGQPEYLLNLGLLYDDRKDDGWSVSILANTYGERISAVGTSGIDDEKEQPRWNLDVSIIKRFGRGALKITAENLLDDKYEFKQGDIATREYKRGFAIGVGYSYTF
ncbi:MAG TPA: TonB-dependent receptor, partial [Planctomycetota bacterium]|nr:TonB-dependent receptor [Planctomycetota bacterium]